MNEDEFTAVLTAVAEDGLDPDRTTDILARLRTRRQRRRRAVSVGAVTAAVVAVAAVASFIVGDAQSGPVAVAPHPSTQTTPTHPTASHGTGSTTTVAAVMLAKYAVPPVISPVNTTAVPATPVEWRLAPGQLWVVWRSTASFTVLTPNRAPTESRGYLITTTPSTLLTDISGKTVVTPHTSTTTVAGHPATETAAPAGTFDAAGYPADHRLSWQLSDGRYIHVFDTDFDAKTPSLTSFAASIRETPTALEMPLATRTTIAGYRLTYAASSPFVGDTLALCPSGIAIGIQAPQGACLTVTFGTSLERETTITGQGDSHGIPTGTLYVLLATHQAQLYPDQGVGPITITAPTALTTAQFAAIAQTLHRT